MKRVVMILFLILLVTACSEERSLDIMGNNKASCDIYDDFAYSEFMEIGDSFVLYGENCNLSIQLVSTSYDSLKVKILGTELEVKIDEPYLTDFGFNIIVISGYGNGARIVFSDDYYYEKGLYYSELKECFGDPKCLFKCEDMDGVVMDECNSLTFNIDSSTFKSKFSEKNCCINKPQKFLILPSKNEYYLGESLKIFFFGPSEANCNLKLTSWEGKEFEKGSRSCKPLQQILGEDLFSNYGEYFGKWNISVKVNSGYREFELDSEFNYKNANLISRAIDFDKEGSRKFKFYSHNFSIIHHGGCTQNVKLEINENNFTLNVGSSMIIDDVNVILKGAACRTGTPVKLLFQVPFIPECNNGFCEAGEDSTSCPWDCLNEASFNISSLDISSECQRGCYYDRKCLNNKNKLIRSKKTFGCSNGKWI